MPQPRMHSNKSSTSAVIGWLDWAISRRHWTLRSGIPWSSSCWNTNYTASKNMYRSMCLLTATVVSQLLHVSACIYCFTQSSSSGMRVIYHNWSATKQRPHPQSVAEISRHSVLSYTSMGMIWVTLNMGRSAANHQGNFMGLSIHFTLSGECSPCKERCHVWL